MYKRQGSDSSVKLIFICSPNNPTGNRLNNIGKLLDRFNGIVVADEAYIDFCPEYSLKEKIGSPVSYTHLIVAVAERMRYQGVEQRQEAEDGGPQFPHGDSLSER